MMVSPKQSKFSISRLSDLVNLEIFILFPVTSSKLSFRGTVKSQADRGFHWTTGMLGIQSYHYLSGCYFLLQVSRWLYSKNLNEYKMRHLILEIKPLFSWHLQTSKNNHFNQSLLRNFNMNIINEFHILGNWTSILEYNTFPFFKKKLFTCSKIWDMYTCAQSSHCLYSLYSI